MAIPLVWMKYIRASAKWMMLLVRTNLNIRSNKETDGGLKPDSLYFVELVRRCSTGATAGTFRRKRPRRLPSERKGTVPPRRRCAARQLQSRFVAVIVEAAQTPRQFLGRCERERYPRHHLASEDRQVLVQPAGDGADRRHGGSTGERHTSVARWFVEFRVEADG